MQPPLPRFQSLKPLVASSQACCILGLLCGGAAHSGVSALLVDRPSAADDLFASFSSVLEEATDEDGGSSVTDHQVFQTHARRFEADFQQDMDALGVLCSLVLS